MAISTLHRLDKIVLPSAVEITELNNAKWDAGIESLIERPAGHAHPMFRATQSQKPVLSFGTPQLATILGAVDAGGASLAATNTYFKKASETGSVARATATHKRITINKGVVYWTTINLEHNGTGTVDVVLTAVYDGVNAPFVYTGSLALSGNLTATEYFGAGPVSLNGVSVPGIQSIKINSGIKLLEAGDASEVWNTFAGIEVTEPNVDITTFEETNWSTLGLAGIALNGATGLVCYARKYAANGSRVANATAEHIKFIGLLGSAIPVDSNGDASSPITDSLRCELVASSDSVLPLTLSAASAIT